MYDIVIRRGRIVDGTGSPWYVGDVAVAGDRIAAVGRLDDGAAHVKIDADGKVICPGFIDMHTHSDLVHLAEPDATPRVMQGVTTDVIGQDGLSYAPVNDKTLQYFRRHLAAFNGDPEELSYDWRTIDDFLCRYDGAASINIAYLVPHGCVQALVMGGVDDRRPTEGEMRRMRELVAQGMLDGACGLSTGLTYAPCSFASTDELVELCSATAEYDGAFLPHLRSYGSDVIQAIDEAVDIAEKSGVALHFTHHQVVFPINEHRVKEYLGVIDDARNRGMDATCDSYCYVAGSTFIRGFLPGWTQSMGLDEFADALSDSSTREKIREQVEVTGCDGSHGVPMDWSRVQISNVKSAESGEWIGMRVDDAAKQSGSSTFDFVAELLLANEGEVSCVAFFGFEEAVQTIMAHPAHMVGSDGILTGEKPHPRAWGCHARYLGRYARELGVLTMEEAVRKMTAAPAAKLGLSDRGLIKRGLAADIVVFDPDTVIDTATFDDPKQHPVGVSHVIVNGQQVLDNGVHTHVRAGRALRRGR